MSKYPEGKSQRGFVIEDAIWNAAAEAAAANGESVSEVIRRALTQYAAFTAPTKAAPTKKAPAKNTSRAVPAAKKAPAKKVAPMPPPTNRAGARAELVASRRTAKK